ncbi:hypothetical protein EBZ39_19900 [bacterium]|jgi:hypothetical protein|nr:hypothetical protein [bacterium]
MIYAKGNGAPAPENQGGVAGAFYPPAATVRDLEAEGILPISVSQSYGSAQLSQTTALIDLQTKYRKLRNDLDGIQEVVASLLKRAQS